MHYGADPAKAARNLAKHGVGFDEAASCLLDPMALAIRMTPRASTAGCWWAAASEGAC